MIKLIASLPLLFLYTGVRLFLRLVRVYQIFIPSSDILAKLINIQGTLSKPKFVTYMGIPENRVQILAGIVIINVIVIAELCLSLLRKNINRFIIRMDTSDF
jgi:hypothetical protein